MEDATSSFRHHENSLCHKEAVEKLLILPATTTDVGELLSSTLAKQKADNRHCLMKVITSLQYLARQGCSIRGHDEKEGNLFQLVVLQSKDDVKVDHYIES